MHAGGRLGLLKALPSEWLPQNADEDFARELERYMSRAAIIGGEWGEAQLGSRPTMSVPLPVAVASFIRGYVRTFADEWVTERAREISDAVAAGLDAGEPMDRIAARLRDVFEGTMSRERATVIARTETIRASSAGALERYREAGVTDKEWSADGEGTCAQCQALHGEQRPMDRPFTGGIDAPPAHPDCRCATLPVLPEYGERGGLKV
ncbi:MAG: hypothetical protein C0498_01435 [Anaerolinea sp.]|nr:hypothetical protein [Anaerolinea sp.]